MTDRNAAAMDKNDEAGERNGGEEASKGVKREETKRRERDNRSVADSTTSKTTIHKTPKKRRKVNHGTQITRFVTPPLLLYMGVAEAGWWSALSFVGCCAPAATATGAMKHANTSFNLGQHVPQAPRHAPSSVMRT